MRAGNYGLATLLTGEETMTLAFRFIRRHDGGKRPARRAA